MDEIKGNELRELTPAQGFEGKVAYTTVTHRELSENRVTEWIEVVTSERKRFPLTQENFFPLGLFTKREPFPTNKWSEKGIRFFLSNKPQPDIKEVFSQIKAQFETYIEFADPEYCSLLALWVIGTYFHRLFSSYPYLHITGEVSTGKTKVITLASLMAFNGELIFNSTGPYLIRNIHNNHATLCIDEAENLKGKDSVLISMLNAGYKRGVYVGKMEKENGSFIPRLFEAYSPKTFASIKGLSKSLASRCIRVQMAETLNPKISNSEINIESPTFQDIRDNLYTLMLTWFPKIKESCQVLTDAQIQGRNWELWKPILALAKMLENKGTEAYNAVRRLAISQIKERREEKRENITSGFLTRLKEIIDAYPLKTNFYPVAYLLQSLKNNPGFENIEGRFIADQLKNLCLAPGGSILKKIDGKVTRGYCLDAEAITKKLKAVTGNG